MNGKIIFVNSYKGGAGKTTLSLMHCINNLFREKIYENVIYLDLDILGTATSYLFDEEKLPREKCFNDTEEAVEIELTLEEETKSLYVAYLDSGFKNKDFSGEEYFLHHKALDEALLKQKVFHFISKNLKQTPSTLLVVDCAPGFSDLEQELLWECYQNAVKWDVEIEEDYVMTLDAAHIRKSLSCLKSSAETFEVRPEGRKIHLVLNDIQNYSKWAKEEGEQDVLQVWHDIAGKIRSELGEIKTSIYCWRYSHNIAIKNTYTREEKVENQVDDYLMTQESYRLLDSE